jgi:hypothetical protein
MQSPKIPPPNDAPPADDEEEQTSRARQGALTWVRQALSDIDRAMESENTEAAQALLHRVQDVLAMLSTRRKPGEGHRISEIRAILRGNRKPG